MALVGQYSFHRNASVVLQRGEAFKEDKEDHHRREEIWIHIIPLVMTTSPLGNYLYQDYEHGWHAKYRCHVLLNDVRDETSSMDHSGAEKQLAREPEISPRVTCRSSLNRREENVDQKNKYS